MTPKEQSNASSKLANSAAEYGIFPLHEEKANLIRMDGTKPLHECREIRYEERKPATVHYPSAQRTHQSSSRAAKFPPNQKRSRAKPSQGVIHLSSRMAVTSLIQKSSVKKEKLAAARKGMWMQYPAASPVVEYSSLA